MNNPKFGYHAIWLQPLALLMLLKDWFETLIHKLKIKWILFRNPKINELVKLSGLDSKD